jgi:cytochrome bd-type quinol oxidase subunit 2
MVIDHHEYFMPDISVLFRFLHIISAVTLLGGALAWRFALLPGLGALAPETRAKAENAAAAAWKPMAIYSSAGILISGIWNVLHKTGLTPAYHAVFGIKVLLALHVIGVAIVAAKADNPRRGRQLTGVIASGVLIVILSAVLRWILTQ